MYAEIVKKGFIEFDKHVNKNLGNNPRAVFVAAENYLDCSFNVYDEDPINFKFTVQERG